MYLYLLLYLLPSGGDMFCPVHYKNLYMTSLLFELKFLNFA